MTRVAPGGAAPRFGSILRAPKSGACALVNAAARSFAARAVLPLPDADMYRT